MQPHYISLTDPSQPELSRRLGYYDWGNSDNPNVIVCVHGLTRNGRDFDALAQALLPHFRILCPDMAGRGVSDRLSNPAAYHYGTYVADIIFLLDQLNIHHTGWVGTSMGGIIGMMLAAQQPQTITRLVLNDVGAVVSAAGLKRILNYAGAKMQFATRDEAMLQLRSIAAPYGLTNEAEWQQLFDASFTPLPAGGYALAYDPGISIPFREAATKAGEITDVDLSAVWHMVQCPALILRGGDSDILSAATAQAMCARAIPTHYVEFPHVGHVPALLDPAQIKVITDWFAQPLDNEAH